YQLHLAEDGDPSIVNPARLSPSRASQVCGNCHAVKNFSTSKAENEFYAGEGCTFRPGDELGQKGDVVVQMGKHDDVPGMMRNLQSEPNFLKDRFWSDGMIRVSGREYNGLIESPCFTHGDPTRQMSCLSCHTMHQPADDPRPVEQWANYQVK